MSRQHPVTGPRRRPSYHGGWMTESQINSPSFDHSCRSDCLSTLGHQSLFSGGRERPHTRQQSAQWLGHLRAEKLPVGEASLSLVRKHVSFQLAIIVEGATETECSLSAFTPWIV